MRFYTLLLMSIFTLSACTPTLVEKLPYYKLTVVQGMPLETEHILALKVGMSRQQVLMEIGEPILQPSFRNDQWTYVYEVIRGNKVKENRQLTIYFNQDTVTRIEGDALTYAQKQLSHSQRDYHDSH